MDRTTNKTTSTTGSALDATTTVEDVVHHVLEQKRRNGGDAAQHEDVTDLSASELIALGAVWYQPATATIDASGSTGVKPQRLEPNQCQLALQEGDYLRIHHHPRRFPAVYEWDWNEFYEEESHKDESNVNKEDNTRLRGVIVAENPKEGWMVIHKPAGIPVHMTVDNRLENVIACLQTSHHLRQQQFRAQVQQQDAGTTESLSEKQGEKPETSVPLAKSGDVYVGPPQRLDQNTSGLLVLATQKAFAAYYAQLLRHKTALHISDNSTRTTQNSPNDPASVAAPSSSKREGGGVYKLYRCLAAIVIPKSSSSADITDEDAAESSASYFTSVAEAVQFLQKHSLSKEPIRHYLEPTLQAPKRFVQVPPSSSSPDSSATKNKASPGEWLECLLRIVEVGPVCALVGSGDAGRELQRQLWADGAGGKPTSEIPAVVQVTVELLTGRTHQIRGQFAAMGLPLVGDEQYMDMYSSSAASPRLSNTDKLDTQKSSSSHPRLALQCCKLEFLKPTPVNPQEHRDEMEVLNRKPNFVNQKKAGDATKFKASNEWHQFELRSAWWTPHVSEFEKQLNSSGHGGQITTSMKDLMMQSTEKDEETVEESAIGAGKPVTWAPTAKASVQERKKPVRADLLPDRVQLSPGRHKYILLKATDPNSVSSDNKASNEPIWFVKSASPAECGGPYHGNVAQDLREWVQAAGYQVTVTGGGRIFYDSEQEKCTIYGFSYGFGKANHHKAAAVVRRWSEGRIRVRVDNSDDLY